MPVPSTWPFRLEQQNGISQGLKDDGTPEARRSHTITSNSKASATKQTVQQPQPAPPSSPRPSALQHSPAVLPRSTYTWGIDGEG